MNRTIERAPTIPSDGMMLEVTARLINTVIRAMVMIETPNGTEFITPMKVLLYIKKMKSSNAKTKPIASSMSKIDISSNVILFTLGKPLKQPVWKKR